MRFDIDFGISLQEVKEDVDFEGELLVEFLRQSGGYHVQEGPAVPS